VGQSDADARSDGLDAGAVKSGQAADAGDAAPPPPTPLATNRALDPEPMNDRELAGLRLNAHWRWQELPDPADSPHLSTAGLAAMKKAAVMQWLIELTSSGRLRVVFETAVFPLKQGTELRKKVSKYGTLALWPQRLTYRVLPAGTVRTSLDERRVDVTPLAYSIGKELGVGKRLGMPTRKLELTSLLGGVVLELARVPEAGRGAVTHCRLLVEVAAIHPSTPVCKTGELVLAAEYSWVDGGGISFELSSLTKHQDLPATAFAIPPTSGRQVFSALPVSRDGSLFEAPQLATLRTEAAAAPEAKTPLPSAPKEGLVANNRSDWLLYLLLDGVPIAVVPPWSEQAVRGPLPGRYSVQWRDFLGELIAPAQQLQLPARIDYGQVDGGLTSIDGG